MMEDTAPQSLRESLSALVDNQASELELHRLLKSSKSHADLRSTWGRYQLISTAIKGETPDGEYVDLSDRICNAIAEESPLELDTSVPVADAGRPWLQPVGKLAVAACVAGFVVIGVQQSAILMSAEEQGHSDVNSVATSSPIEDHTPVVMSPLSASTVSSVNGVNREQLKANQRQTVNYFPRTGTQSVPHELIQKRLDYLLLEHAEHAAQNSGRGMLPFARISRMDEK